MKRFSLRHAHERGAASVEAAIVAPVLVLLLVSVLYFRDQAVTRQAAEMEARTCAWLYSVNNCERVPPGCDGKLTQETRDNPASSAVLDALQGGESQSVARADKTGVVSKIVDSLLGPALKAAFGRGLEAKVAKELERPAMYGGGKNTITGRYRLACNLTPEDPTDVAKDAWSLFRP